MEAYSDDLRLRILQDCDAGMSTRVAATKYRVCESWLRRLKQRRRETGEVSARSPQRKSGKVLDEHRETLERLLAEQADATLAELQERLPVRVGQATIWRALQELKFSFKKKSSGRRSRTGKTSAKNGRRGKPK